MLIYGTKGTIIKSGSIRNVVCGNCKNETTMDYAVFAKYFHLYWIPFFPYRKEKIIECKTCDDTFNLKDLSQKTHDKFQRERENTGNERLPIWLFSGLILLTILIGAAFYQSGQTERKELQYIKEPKIGDIYSYKVDSTSRYTTMKVDRVSKDSVFAIQNNYETDKLKGIHEINKPTNYNDFKIALSRAKLKELYQDNTIYSVER